MSVNPQPTRLFDPFDSVLTEKTRKRLLNAWPGAFRYVILELMPVDAVNGYFNPTMGRPAVFHAIYLKIAGWNILRASVCAKMRKIVWERASMAVFEFNLAFLRMPIAADSVGMNVKRRFLLHCRESEKFPKLSIAA